MLGEYVTNKLPSVLGRLNKQYALKYVDQLIVNRQYSSVAVRAIGSATSPWLFHQGTLQSRDNHNKKRSGSVLLPRIYNQPQYHQNRGLLHIPLLGVLTPKILAALAMKKAVVVAVLHKYGLKGTFDILRTTNDQLATQLGKTTYPPAARNAVRAGLDALEVSIGKLSPEEQADVVYKWLKTVDPTLLVESFKKYITTSPGPVAEETPQESVDAEKEVEAIKSIEKLFPEIAKKYHVVLVARDQDQDKKQ